MKKTLYLIIALTIVFMAGCAGQRQNNGGQPADKSPADKNKPAVEENKPKPADNKDNAASPKGDNKAKVKKVAVIETKKGKIVFELFFADAPNTAANFEKLANKGFYNGLTFHRVEPGFVIQGGDPDGNGSGGPGYTIPEELNARKHEKGAVGMATQGTNSNTGGSQFYITLAAQPALDGGYTVFGQVIEGMDVVQKIEIGDVMTKVTIAERD